ncbi:MAG: copper chaperone PCu(A)C [Pseudomonadota bacterium]
MNRSPLAAALAAFALTAALPAAAQVSIKDPWVRGTAAQQRATGMFVQLTSAQPSRLVGAASPVAGVVEIHEMSMDGNVMRMRAVAGLALPAGRTVELKPGGFHVMLMDLRQPLQPGDTVPVTLLFDSGGKRDSVEVKATVRAAAATAGHGHKH